MNLTKPFVTGDETPAASSTVNVRRLSAVGGACDAHMCRERARARASERARPRACESTRAGEREREREREGRGGGVRERDLVGLCGQQRSVKVLTFDTY